MLFEIVQFYTGIIIEDFKKGRERRKGFENTECSFYQSGECLPIGNCPKNYLNCETFPQ